MDPSALIKYYDLADKCFEKKIIRVSQKKYVK